MKTLSEHRCFDGVQGFYEHDSAMGPMRFGVFMPSRRPAAAVYYLAGLECNEQTFATKAGAQRVAASLGLALITPDTSPRTLRFQGDADSWDFGIAASFYLDAALTPWRMHTYVTQELRQIVKANFALSDRAGIMGHSMGGHGALTLGLQHPEIYTSVSAIAPISSPSQVPWGQKAFTGYLGEDRAAWAACDATELVMAGRRTSAIRIDQGTSDKFLNVQLKPEIFADACKAVGQQHELHLHDGFDHGYYFVSTVIEEQLRHHAQTLT